MDIPSWMKEDFKTTENKAKARLTEFYAKKPDNQPVIYGTVLEVYSPDFKNPKDGINQIDINQINPTTGSLQDSGIPMDEIWERLDKASEDNERDDIKERYEQSQKLSKNTLESLHKKIEKYINK